MTTLMRLADRTLQATHQRDQSLAILRASD
jgi:hypothetical protein